MNMKSKFEVKINWRAKSPNSYLSANFLIVTKVQELFVLNALEHTTSLV